MTKSQAFQKKQAEQKIFSICRDNNISADELRALSTSLLIQQLKENEQLRRANVKTY